jgi:hypothetical protein
MSNRHTMRWGAITVIAAAGITFLATTAMPRGSGAPESLEVVLSDASTRQGSECDPASYEGTFFDGTEVELADGAGQVLATTTVTDPAAATKRGCSWTVTFDKLPKAESYTLTLRNTESPNREHTYSYTAKELAEDASLWIAVVR